MSSVRCFFVLALFVLLVGVARAQGCNGTRSAYQFTPQYAPQQQQAPPIVYVLINGRLHQLQFSYPVAPQNYTPPNGFVPQFSPYLQAAPSNGYFNSQRTPTLC